MYKIGEYQLLEVESKLESGFLLKAADEEKSVLLPTGEIKGEINVEDHIMVFIYLDTKDRIVATMKEPLATLGDIAYLKLADIVEFGVFFDIGLQRDLFMPLQEKAFDLEIGKKYLVYVYLDKSSRLCATTKVYDYLTVDHDYKSNDMVKGTIIRINPEVGVYIAVDNKFQGMIPMNEYYDVYKEGQEIELRVIRVREDKKLDLATRQLVKDQLIVDAEKVYFLLVKAGGKLNFHDKSSPESIKAEFQLSKKAFKRAIGRLMKEDKIEMYETYIEKK